MLANISTTANFFSLPTAISLFWGLVTDFRRSRNVLLSFAQFEREVTVPLHGRRFLWQRGACERISLRCHRLGWRTLIHLN
jgi:hypothetical protein